MIESIIERIPSDEIYIIYNTYLEQYNFEEIIINLFKEKKLYFSKIDYSTRGAVETAYIGMNGFSFSDKSENLVFLDNDNIHSISDNPLHYTSYTTSFIGYGKDYIKQNYSFITIANNKVVNIEEKKKISNTYCCGIYGFQNVDIFKKYAITLLNQDLKTNGEFYFSQIYKLMIKDGHPIIPIYIENTIHIGTYDEILANDVPHKKLRVCFDLDNTLVSYPTIPNDYSSVKPIEKMIKLLQILKIQGHEIIIHTARRMKTHNNNVGKVIKDVALDTLFTLEKYGIPYDELIFGKPLADIYIDDKSINPYINNISYFGIFHEEKDFFPNKVENNKYNKIKKTGNIIKKTGPLKFLRGEQFFYQNIPSHISNLFPRLIDSEQKSDDSIEISLDYINGIPLFFLHKNKLITTKHIDDLFQLLEKLHHEDFPITIKECDVRNNYFEKLKVRFTDKNDYDFDDSQEVYDSIINDLHKYYSPQIVGIIHGDFWFSNIILEYNNDYKVLDMKGHINDILSLNGDRYYDYGKFYQSILGYDLILNNCEIDNEYIFNLQKYFLTKCREIQIDVKYLTAVTKSLIFGTLHSIPHKAQKARIWSFIKTIK